MESNPIGPNGLFTGVYSGPFNLMTEDSYGADIPEVKKGISNAPENNGPPGAGLWKYVSEMY